MCVRTKTTYGCGDVYQTTTGCHSPDCLGLDKYVITKEGDCRGCKRQGTALTRGRDGLGRYAQEIQRRQSRSRPSSVDRSSVSSYESERQRSGFATSPEMPGISPWATPVLREKTWETSHRRQADEAWLSEHENRMIDLQRRIEEATLSSKPDPTTPTPKRRELYDVESELDNKIEHSSPERFVGHERIKHPEPMRKYILEFQRRNDDSTGQRSSSGRSYQPEVRQHSYDSLPDSMPSYRSSPRHRAYSGTQPIHCLMPASQPQYHYLRHQYHRSDTNQEYEYSTPNTPQRILTTPKRYPARAQTEPYPYSGSTGGGYDHEYEHDYSPRAVILDTAHSPIVYPFQSPGHDNSNKYYRTPPDHRYRAIEPSPLPYVTYQPRY